MQIPFYFDFACPWAYLGSTRAEAYFADLDVELDFRPVLLSMLRETATPALQEGVTPPANGPRKQRNAVQDFRHWVELCGAEVSPDARRNRREPRLLAQAAWVAKDALRYREFHYPAYRARFAEAADISDPAVVRRLLMGAGLDGDAALARAQSPEYVARVEQESRAAIERGVFGVPTLFVGDEMFWGNDRFELVRHYVMKEPR